MKLAISILQAAPQPTQRRSRSRQKRRTIGRKHHRSSPSPTSIIVDFDEFCDAFKKRSASVDRESAVISRKGGDDDSPPRRWESTNGATKSPQRRQNAVGRALFQMGRAEAQMGQWKDALERFDRAVHIQVECLGNDHEDVARTLIERGTVHAARGSWYDSILDLERGLHIQRGLAARSRTEEGVDIAETFIRVGQVQHQRGNYVESVGSFRSALDILRRVEGENSPSVALVSGIVAKSQHQRRRYTEAIESYRNCLSAFEAAGIKRDHPDVAWVRRHLADRTMFANCVADFWDDSAVV